MVEVPVALEAVEVAVCVLDAEVVLDAAGNAVDAVRGEPVLLAPMGAESRARMPGRAVGRACSELETEEDASEDGPSAAS